MKKFLSIFLCTTILISSTGCSTQNQTSSGKSLSKETVLTLALREGTYSNVISDCLSTFEEENNIKCQILELSENDLYQSIASSNQKSSIDICMVDSPWVTEFTSNNILTNLSELGYSFDDDIIPATTDIAYYEGNIYLTPYFGNVSVLMYNTNIINAAGYENSSIDNLDDIMTICQYAQDNGKYGFMYRNDSNSNVVVDFLPFLLSYGGWLVDVDNNPTINTESFKNAISFYSELIKTGQGTTKEDVINALYGENAAMAIGWPGWYTKTDDDTVDYCAITGKVSKGTAAYNANVYGIWGLGIVNSSENKELSYKLLQYLMDREVQKSTIDNGGVPCRYSCLMDSDVLAKYPQYKSVCEALESGIYRPNITYWNDFVEILGEKITEIANGEITIDQGLEDAQAALDIIANKD
ncbi:MAG: extracellular solute-binding protein [Butyrivibrio sp.]|nr:extracellular solute-binding protein [Butyrivibrio sp.]